MSIQRRVLIRKADGSEQEFNPGKLHASLVRSGATEAIAREIVDHISREVQDGMSTHQIYDHANFLLRKHGQRGTARYSLRKAIAELGPSGFPFEKYIAEIFKTKGYKAITNQIQKGHYVEHEIDVQAWNENKLIFCEAKFHNQFGIKSDLKVALYVKARFDDLYEAEFVVDGKKRKLDEGWLVTNTKFSLMAIQYGQHQRMRMVGWNYPDNGNLHDMIEDGDLHPITALTSLMTVEKTNLLNQGIVLAKTLAEPGFLEAQGFKPDRIRLILTEIKTL